MGTERAKGSAGQNRDLKIRKVRNYCGGLGERDVWVNTAEKNKIKRRGGEVSTWEKMEDFIPSIICLPGAERQRRKEGALRKCRYSCRWVQVQIACPYPDTLLEYRVQ